MQQHDAEPYFACFNQHRIFMRKAQCHFGWDWAPNCPGIGIWESVLLETYDQVCLDEHNINTHCDGAVSLQRLMVKEICYCIDKAAMGREHEKVRRNPTSWRCYSQR